ncbi:hypothetical protein FBZ33_4128 [Micromonospora sp. A202]|uniref:hypothetical protein n=1 Tax=Micromonospora sp. A202 TaxID=2572899 RepID=UPI00115187CC|nr:hypothetical protein [Micromonospora sp. A202]TQJ23808.1 hypothetical protein FBZ33_4128 [Micromonospora sp. A202]
MTLPPGHQSQQREEPNSTAPSDERLDQPSEDSGSWTVETVDGGATSGVTSVAAPVQPPELHPGAAAALLKLLRHVNDSRTDNSNQENG